MDDNNEANDFLLLLGMTLFFSCVEQHVNLIDYDEASNVFPDTNIEIQEQNTLSVKSFVKDKAIEMYAKKGLENLKKQLKSSEPFVMGSIDKEKVKENDINVAFQLKNIKLFNLSSFQLIKFKSISEQNAAEFAFELPFLKAIANYDISGSFKGKKVDGKGESEIKVSEVSINDGRVVIKETPEEIQIASFDMCYDFKDLEVKQSGLNIESLPAAEVTKFLNESGKKYLRDNRKKLCERVTKEIKNRVNAKLKGKNREQLMEMMKRA